MSYQNNGNSYGSPSPFGQSPQNFQVTGSFGQQQFNHSPNSGSNSFNSTFMNEVPWNLKNSPNAMDLFGVSPRNQMDYDDGVGSMNSNGRNPIVSPPDLQVFNDLPGMVSNMVLKQRPPSPQTAAFTFTNVQNEDNFTGSQSSDANFTFFRQKPHQTANRGIRILVNPVEYQVVNYNIFPAPELEFSHTSEAPVTVSAFLVYCDETSGQYHKIQEGFTNGDVQVLKTGQSHIAFPALHLSRMTPIKHALQQAGLTQGSDYAILFRVDDLELISQPFKLVSACNRIPEGVNMRPRQPKEKGVTPAATPIAPSVPTAAKTTTKVNANPTKRRAVDELSPAQDDISYVRVLVRGENDARGFIGITPSSTTLQEAREEISRSPNYPKSFRFWFKRLQAIVQLHQEENMKASDGVEGEVLTIEPYEPTLQNVDRSILDLWMNKKEKDPLIPIVTLIQTMIPLEGAEFSQTDLRVITSGISHFFVNTAKHSQPNVISLDDFKLFLKFFGPTNIFKRVFNVYGEPYFHGFARHYDAAELLKDKPGYFLVRYSESQLKDGYFAFNVNKGNKYRDVIENYTLPYSSEQGCFVFRDKQYKSLAEFITDDDFAPILLYPLPKLTVETIKPSKYKSHSDWNGSGASGGL
eukprot:TRINITY_DN2971_c0_g1_i2.p1 TRINITY_DN2971_c0_g1~~TRINITY_DN2971_c0_g1_i2.p1  ORF type:complete len:637 (-),score=203.78 TRINITY_DN2971_c0_g1_i2:49-1959(-)